MNVGSMTFMKMYCKKADTALRVMKMHNALSLQ